MSKVLPPFNLHKWIEEHGELLKPPVGNKNLYVESEDYIVMIVGGPNARKDYHYNESEEWFYQIKGDIEVGIQIDDRAEVVSIKEGDMFLLPARIPHSPRRPENSVGLVIELKRKSNMIDGLMWFCEQCNHKLHEYYFPLENIEKDFLPRFKEFYSSLDLLTCKSCGHIMEADPRFVS